ncbi:putative extracellular developmental signal biosynthesis protein [Phaeomoniella chlamydospora]|uniref:Putative extracellular developmental signal biosynthesis protein n=1 Tax=Phaeomoniella chlamydospora TaxID=158046 RepID=A0A0G2GMG2_PHACM|nr:putative extracellular developmental signal biosynthesis protein [Phaeomoniella chlamydospora]
MPANIPENFKRHVHSTGAEIDHGPADVELANTSAAVQKFFLDNPSIKYVRLQWTDMAGMLRARIATKAWALRLVAQNKPVYIQSPMTSAMQLGGIMYETLQLGSDSLWPQWETLRGIGYVDGHAAVSCHIKDCSEKLEHGYELDPRSALKRKVAEVRERAGLEFLVGYEIEFIILEIKNPQTGEEQPLETGSGIWTTDTYRNKSAPVLGEILDILNDAGVEVRQYHSEGANGMFEISTEPLPPLQAVDELYFAQEVIKGVCYKHGLRGTLHVQPTEGGPHVGCHTHISIVGCDSEKVAGSFTQGVLNSMPGLIAIGMPSWVSYVRASFLGGWVMWANDFKGCPFRRVNPMNDFHWELRWPDFLANHYLFLTALLGVAAAAVEQEVELEMKPRTKNTLTKIETEEREETGIKRALPSTMRQGLDALEQDEIIKKEMGSHLFERFLQNKNAEEEAFKNIPTEAERRARIGTAF